MRQRIRWFALHGVIRGLAKFGMRSGDPQARLLADPHVVVGSDGGGGGRHPRGHGTFAKVIRESVIEKKDLSLEEAVRKMTGATAAALRLRDRGLLREGWRADIAIFDPADFNDRATSAEPHRYPSGARTTVLVNGAVVVEDARHTGALPGMVLRRAADGTVG